MSRPPVPCVFKGGVFHPLGRVRAAVAQSYGDGEIVMLEEVEERSPKSHAHEFAWLKEAWLSLPEAVTADYPTPEHLRKRALIATGYCSMTDYACGSNAEAVRWAVNLRKEVDEYTLVIVTRVVVRVFKAESQSKRSMGGERFQKSKTAILEWVSNLIGVDPAQLAQARAA